MSGTPERALVEAWNAGANVLSAWFFDDRFRAAYKPEPEIFSSHPTHFEVACLAAELGPALRDTDVLVYELKRREKLERAGGMIAVEQLITATPAVADPWREVDRLKRAMATRALRRDMLAVCSEIERGELNFEGAEERAAKVLRDARSSTGAGIRMLSMADIFAEVRREIESEEAPDNASSGSNTIDKATGGIARGDVWVMASETNFGKTSYIILLCELERMRGGRPAIVTGEDHPRLIGRRFMARRAKVNAMKLRDRKLDRFGNSRVVAEAMRAEKEPFMLDARGMPIEHVASAMTSVSASEGITLWLFDYVQVFESLKDQDSRALVGYVARKATNAIKEADCAGVLLSQITDPPEGKQPSRKDLRDNKAIAHAAECVLVGYLDSVTETVDGGEKKTRQKRMFKLDKNKSGPKPIVAEIDWDDDFAGFVADPAVLRRFDAEQETFDYSAESA